MSAFALPTSQRLTLVCRKCTRVAEYAGIPTVDACAEAVKAGWRRVDEAFICPKCPTIRASKHVAV